MAEPTFVLCLKNYIYTLKYFEAYKQNTHYSVSRRLKMYDFILKVISCLL